MMSKSIYLHVMVTLSVFYSECGKMVNGDDYTACPPSIGQSLSVIPNPNQCNKFYYCVLGNLIEFTCPNGLHFDRVRNACTPPTLAQCHPLPNWTTSPTPEPTTNTKTALTTKTPTTIYPSASPNNDCGTLIKNGTFWNLISPNYGTYPGYYGNNLDCYHRITGPEGVSLWLHINFLDLEINYDYIKIFNGSHTDGTILGHLNANTAGEDVFLQTNDIEVHFHSDDKLPKKGFNLTFDLLPSSETGVCGRLTRNGTLWNLLSHNFGLDPGFYGNNLDCNYRITGPEGTSLSLHIDYMQLEYNNDYIKIFNGSRSFGNVLGNLTGNIIRENVYFQTNDIELYFHSDASVPRKGFNLTFKADVAEMTTTTELTTTKTSTTRKLTTITSTIKTTPKGTTEKTTESNSDGCGLVHYTMGTTSGYFVSPNYPGNYENNEDCNYIVTSPPNTFLSLRIIYLDLESGYDFVDIFAGGKIISQITGIGQRNDIGTNTNSVRAHFHSDAIGVRSGFNISFTATPLRKNFIA